jgi:hypothetical protein
LAPTGVTNTNNTVIGARTSTSPNYNNFFEGELDSVYIGDSLYKFSFFTINDGVINEYVYKNLLTSLNLTDLSVSLWVKINDLIASTGILFRLSTVDDSINIKRNTSSNKLAFNSVVSTSDEYYVRDWINIIVTQDGATDEVNIYVNNSLVGTGTEEFYPFSINTSVNIGGQSAGPAVASTAAVSICDVRLFNKVLSSLERSLLYNNGSIDKEAIGDELIWYKFDDGSGTTITDSGSLGIDATTLNTDNTNWVSSSVNSEWLFDETPTARVYNVSWDRIANDIGMAKFRVAGIGETNSDIRNQRDVYIVENNKLKWTGTVRDVTYSTYKIAEVTAKTWEVNLDDRKYYDTISSSYSRDWSDITSSDVIKDLLVSSDLSEGDIENYPNTYNFSIRNDTCLHGVSKNADITNYDFFVSRDVNGGEE